MSHSGRQAVSRRHTRPTRTIETAQSTAERRVAADGTTNASKVPCTSSAVLKKVRLSRRPCGHAACVYILTKAVPETRWNATRHEAPFSMVRLHLLQRARPEGAGRGPA